MFTVPLTTEYYRVVYCLDSDDSKTLAVLHWLVRWLNLSPTTDYELVLLPFQKYCCQSR